MVRLASKYYLGCSKNYYSLQNTVLDHNMYDFIKCYYVNYGNDNKAFKVFETYCMLITRS